MSIENSPSIAQPLPTIKLWTPNTISFLTFFIGFPSGTTLAAINWIRLGMKKKALAHIVGYFVSLSVLFLLPTNLGRLFGLLVNLGYVAYLRQQMKVDIEKTSNYNIRYSNWLSGTLVSLIGWGVFLVFGIVMVFLQPLIPGTSSYYYAKGVDYFDKGDYKNAVTNYDKAIERDPKDIYSYNNRGLTYINLGDYDRAIADFNKAMELDPNYDKPYYNRALAYEDLRQTSDAIQDFEKVLELSTDLTLRKYAEEELKKLKGQ